MATFDPIVTTLKNLRKTPNPRFRCPTLLEVVELTLSLFLFFVLSRSQGTTYRCFVTAFRKMCPFFSIFDLKSNKCGM